MKQFVISHTHDASCCVLGKNDILFQEGERFSKKRHDHDPYNCFWLFYDLVESPKQISFFSYNDNVSIKDRKKFLYNSLNFNEFEKGFDPDNDEDTNHHIYHAYCGLYFSNFDEAAIIVADGCGKTFLSKTQSLIIDNVFHEAESVYYFNKNVNYNLQVVRKNYYSSYNYSTKPFIEACSLENKYTSLDINKIIKAFEQKFKLRKFPSIGRTYEYFNDILGYGENDSGKIMGLSAFGKQLPIDDFIIEKNGWIYYNNNYFCFGESNSDVKLDKEFFPVLENYSFQQAADISLLIQKSTEKYVLNLVEKTIQATGCKNLVLSGGVFQNILINSLIAEKFPDVNVFPDPLCYDAGLSIGKAFKKLLSYTKYEEITRPKNLFLSYNHPISKQQIQENLLPGESIIECDHDHIADLLNNNQVVCLFQGGSEAGHRALGNRSILFNPCNPDGKDIVNQIKLRESYRPFAGSICIEDFGDYFDNTFIKENKFMMFNLKVKNDKKSLIPAITHVDGTCRVQTVSKEDNFHFYNLLRSFEKVSGIPILLNTSFNLASEPIVEFFKDALDSSRRSLIQYIYFPDIKLLFYSPNNLKNHELIKKKNYSHVKFNVDGWRDIGTEI